MKVPNFDKIAEHAKNDPSFMDKVKGLLRMLRAKFVSKTYDFTSKKAFYFGVVALIYTILPIDLIPEIAIGPFGLLDDALILGWAWSQLSKEILHFMQWEQENTHSKPSKNGLIEDVPYTEA